MSAALQNSRPRNKRPTHNIPNNRGGYSNNNYRRETPENETPPSPSANNKVYDDHRTAMMMGTVLGAHSSVKTRNGNVYTGHIHAFSDQGDIAMTDAKLEVEDSAREQHIPGIVIAKDNFVVCITNGVDIKGLAIGSAGFTDSGITSRVNGSSHSAMKELQPWHDDDADTTTSMSLEDDKSGGWDPNHMFKENKEKFNVTSSFPEDLRGYTTELPDPTSEGYEERQRFAQKKADEIERSEIYRSRIAKENEDGDEESKYSSVHRNDKDAGHRDGHPGSSVKPYTCPALRGGDNEQNAMRNGNQPRQAGRPGPRQNSPNFTQSLHNSRQQHMNSQYHQGAPLPNRNQRQQQSQSPNHGPQPSHPHHHPHSMQQAPPMSQPPLQPSRHPPPQITSQPSKPNLPHSSVPSLTQQQQHVAAQKTVHPQQVSESKAAPLHNSQLPSSHRVPVSQQHVNGGHHHSEVNIAHNTNPTSCAPLIPAPKVSEPTANVNPADHKPGPAASAAAAPPPPQNATSPPAIQGAERRNGRGQDSSTDESQVKLKLQQFRDFSTKFVLDDGTKSQESSSESTEDSSAKSNAASCGTSGIGSGTSSESSSSSNNANAVAGPPPPSSSTTSSVAPASDQKSGTAPKAGEKQGDADNSKSEVKSTLNPLAAEFKPKAIPSQVEAQASPPPPLRVSPHVMPPTYAQNMTWVPAGAIPAGISYTARTKGVLPMSRDITAQVTGQPLLAHGAHGQHMIYMPQGQSYQVFTPGARMVAPNSFPVSQTGQQGGMDQSSPQPQQVFVTGQQQLMPTPIPAHLTHHPQPAHGQPMPNPTSGQQPQPAHIPNPAPSPVQHHHQPQQQQPQTHGGQPMPHPIPQGPPQSVTPQPTHYSHVNLQQGLQGMPRTSAAQHGVAPGHPSVSVNYQTLQQYSYPNASSAQNSFVPAPQPQMSQNSNHHNPGHQPQYVMMPQPQGHSPMQHLPGQPYSSPAIQFQPQPNHILHGPPQMPPNHSHNPNQGANFIHSAGVQGMPAGIQQVPGGPSSVLMPMQSPLQPYQPQP